jgi:truncated hemoglobin YjbI
MTYFYGHLFAADPEIRSMFPPAMDAQRARLADALRRIMSGTDAELAGYLSELGRAHRKFGVRDEHYEIYRQALVTMLRRFGEPGTLREFEDRFDHVALIMTRAAQEDSARFPAWWTAEVTAVESCGADVAVLTLTPDVPFPYQAGERVSVQTPRWPRQWQEYLIADVPAGSGTLRLRVRACGDAMVSNALVHHTRPGDILLIGAPAPAAP